MTDHSTLPGAQWFNWAERLMAGEHLEEEMQNAGVLPNFNMPLPPTNATIHVLGRELGYGTPDRTFIAACGIAWRSRESTGEHKYFMRGDSGFFKHVNCSACRQMIDNGEL